jgi:hypothetical protein
LWRAPRSALVTRGFLPRSCPINPACFERIESMITVRIIVCGGVASIDSVEGGAAAAQHKLFNEDV